MNSLMIVLLCLLSLVRASHFFPVRGSAFRNIEKSADSGKYKETVVDLFDTFNKGAYWVITEIWALDAVHEECPEILKCLTETYAKLRVYKLLIEKGALSLSTSCKVVMDVLQVANKELVNAVCATVPKDDFTILSCEIDLTKNSSEFSSSIHGCNVELFKYAAIWKKFQKQLLKDIEEILKSTIDKCSISDCAQIYIVDMANVFGFIASCIQGGTNYIAWSINFESAISRHFDQIWRLYTEPCIHSDIHHDTLLLLAKLDYRFADEIQHFHFVSLARLGLFESICETNLVEGSYNARKSAWKKTSIEDHPMKNLKVINGAFQLSGILTTSILTSIAASWDDSKFPATRKLQLLQIMLGLDHIANMLNVAMAAANANLKKSSWDGLNQILMILFRIIPVANRALWKVIESEVAVNIKNSISKYMLDDELNKAKNGPMFLTVYDMLEGQLYQLYQKDSFMAKTLFQLIELCRGFVILSESIKSITSIDSFKEPIYTSLNVLTESQNYITEAFNENEMNFSTRTYCQARQFVTLTLAAFTHMFNTRKISDDMEYSWYAYLEKRVSNDKNSKYWGSIWDKFREEVREKISKKKPIIIDTKKKQTKNEVTQEPAKTNAGKISIKTASKLRSGKKKRPVKRESEKTDVIKEVEIAAEQAMVVRFEEQKEVALPLENSKIVLAELPQNESFPSLKINYLPKLKKIGVMNLKKPSKWSEVSHNMMPSFRDQLVIAQKIPVFPKALEYRVVEKFEEPSHHLSIARQIGYKPGKLDPRDYLMAIILIGQRVWKRKIEPLLKVLEEHESYSYLAVNFKKSIHHFESELCFIDEMDPSTTSKILQEAGIADSKALFSYIKYYKMRLAVCHPIYPKSTDLIRSIQARHLTALEVSNSMASRALMNLRHSMENYTEVFVRAIDKENRSDGLFSIHQTEAILATIGLYQLHPSEELKSYRNKYAHQEVDDLVISEYLNLVFTNHEDYEFLTGLLA